MRGEREKGRRDQVMVVWGDWDRNDILDRRGGLPPFDKLAEDDDREEQEPDAHHASQVLDHLVGV